MVRRFLAAAAVSVLASSPAWAAADNFDLDALHTFPSFEVNHLGFSVMRGSFLSTSGALVYDEATHTGSVKATIDAASISTGYSKRDDHLRSPDFFNVSKFPNLVFTADSFALEADKPVAVKGSLTMLGVTKPVTVNVKPTRCGKRMDKDYVCGAMVTAAIKRSDWGMNMYTPFIGDDITIQVEVEAVKK